MRFPPVCPEIPVRALAESLAYYRDRLGFEIDWSDEQLGLAGLSKGDSRLFMASTEFRTLFGSQIPIVLWINLGDRGEVDALHAQWLTAGADLAGPPQAKPYKLYEFLARDLDGNVLRIFYDFGGEDGEDEG